MPQFKKYKLEEISTRIGDGLHGTPIYDECGEYIFVNGSNLFGGKITINSNTKRVNEDQFHEHKRELSANTILLGINGTIGNVALYDNEKCILGKSACYINVHEKFERKFIYYVLLNEDFQNYIRTTATGTTIKNVGLKAIREYELLIPNLPTQTRIASILSALDDKIELNRRTNATLEAMAQTLFKKYFVDDIDPDNLPEGWRWGKLGDLFYQSKESINPGNYPDKHFCHYSIPAFDQDKRPAIETGESILSNKTIVKSHSILFSKLNPRFPRVWPIGNINESDSICSTEFLVLLPHQNKSYAYVYLQLMDSALISDLVNKATGTSGSHQRIRPDDILNTESIVPSEEKLSEFQKIVEPIISKTISNLNENFSLMKIRDSLLPKLMSGEIEVSTAEQDFVNA